MINSWTRPAVAAVAALTFGLAMASTPASAHDDWVGPGIAAGVLGGMALGAAAASAAQPRYYAPAPVYGGDCWIERRPVYDNWGNYIGRRRIRVCE
jgi:hypothetical protein